MANQKGRRIRCEKGPRWPRYIRGNLVAFQKVLDKKMPPEEWDEDRWGPTNEVGLKIRRRRRHVDRTSWLDGQLAGGRQ